MEPKQIAQWMLAEIGVHGCIYQDDVVDRLVKDDTEELLRENTDGNLVIGKSVLETFKKLTETTVLSRE